MPENIDISAGDQGRRAEIPAEIVASVSAQSAEIAHVALSLRWTAHIAIHPCLFLPLISPRQCGSSTGGPHMTERRDEGDDNPDTADALLLRLDMRTAQGDDMDAGFM
jgi:hypothetical protein